MPAMKRPAATVAAAAAAAAAAGKKVKKDRRERQHERQQATIAAALENAQMSTGVRDLLLSVLPAALLPQPRHDFQEEAVRMLEKELLAIKECFETRIAELQADVVGADAKRAILQAAADEAHANLDTKSTAANEAKEKLDEVSAQLKEAFEMKSKEELSKSELFDSVDSAADKVELLKQTKALKESILGNDEPASVDVVDSNLRQLVKDLNLLDAVKKCLKKNLADHSQFEKLVIQQLDNQLVTLDKQWMEMQSEGTGKKAEAEERVNAALAKVDACLQAKEKCRQALEDATDARKEVDKAARAAKKDLKEFEGNVPGMQKKLEGAQVKLTAFTSGALANFQKLKEGNVEPAENENEESPSPTEKCDIAEDAREATLPVAPTEAA